MNAAHRVASTLCVALAMLGCSDGTSTPDAATRDANRLDGALDARTDDVSNGVDVSIVSDADATTGDAMVPDGGGCSDGCATPGFACSEGRCVAD